MSEADISDIIAEKNRLVAENWQLRTSVRDMLDSEAGCGHFSCNIGGGPCADCLLVVRKYKTRLRELLGMTKA